VFGDSSDDESLPSKRQKLSDGEDSDDDVPLSAVTKKDSGEFMGLVSHMFIFK
jgi:hypothetical protein